MKLEQKRYRVLSRVQGIALICFFLLTAGVWAQEVKSSLDRDTLRIGEQINYKIEVETDASSVVVFPQGQSFLPLEIIDSTAIDTFKTKNTYKLQKIFPLTQFDSGSYTIPRQTIIINGEGYYTDTFTVRVNDVVVDTTKQNLYPIKPALPIKTPLRLAKWMWWLLGLLGVAALAYLLVKTREKIREAKRELPPYEKAIQSLKMLDEDGSLEKGRIKDFYTQLIDTLKRYVDEKMDERALESTTDEFIVLLRQYKKEKELYLKAQVIDGIEAILKRSDLVKFAGMQMDRLTAKEDRQTIEDNISTFDAAIPEPTEEEKMLDEVYRQEVERRRKRRRTGYRIALGIGILLIGLGSFLALKGADYTKSLLSLNPTEKLLKKEWITSEYGTLGITLSSPEILRRHTDTTDLVFPGKAESEERFSFGNIKGRFYTQVTNVRVHKLAKIDSIDVGRLLDTELAFAEADNVTFKSEEFRTLNNEKGQRVFGNFTVNDPLARSARRKTYTFLVFIERGGLQEVLITYDQNDELGKEIEERMINSVEFNKDFDG